MGVISCPSTSSTSKHCVASRALKRGTGACANWEKNVCNRAVKNGKLPVLYRLIERGPVIRLAAVAHLGNGIARDD
jgi:hypothetical protein